jgi:signal transduction histidine kinase
MINDNGKGFDTFAKRNGIGLRNINHRAAVYHGIVDTSSAEGNDCKMKITFNTTDHAA